MSHYKRPTIEKIGLKTYLDNTAALHDGKTYNDFKKMLDMGVSKANIARSFKVERPTIYKWIDIHQSK